MIGTGGLARALCYSLAAMALPLHVLVLGRDADRTGGLCFVANARAACGGPEPGARPSFQAVVFEPAAGDGALRPETFAGVNGVLVCASTQSPWERLSRPSAWTELAGRAGFGLTLPFQAELAALAGRAIAGLRPRPWLVNACFPDAVNPLLAALGIPVLCGVGNVALLAVSAQVALGLPDQRRLRMLAHHLHLHAPAAGEPEALAWLDGEPVDAGPLLVAQRAADRPELNHVTGHAAAHLVPVLLGGGPLDTHLPGPLGLPGGYPVTVRSTEVALRLPPGIGEADAIAFNQRAALADGIVIEDGRVRFGPAATAELDRIAPDLAAGFATTDLPSATAALQTLRARLRALPSSTTAEQESRLRCPTP